MIQYWTRRFDSLSFPLTRLFSNPESQTCCQLKFWLPIGCAAFVGVYIFGCVFLCWLTKKVSDVYFFLHLLKNISSYLLIKAHIALARVIWLTDRQFLFHKICLLIKLLTWQRSLFILQLRQSKKGFDGLQRELLLLLFKKDKGIGAKKTQKGRMKPETKIDTSDF